MAERPQAVHALHVLSSEADYLNYVYAKLRLLCKRIHMCLVPGSRLSTAIPSNVRCAILGFVQTASSRPDYTRLADFIMVIVKFEWS